MILQVLFYLFFGVVLIQCIFYGYIFGKFVFANVQAQTKKNISISVIICAKNESENLSAFLPSVIDQNYPDFEIVLVNDGSHDDTLKVMEHFKALHANIKIVDVKPIEAFWGNKKYALTLGIKAATNRFLLFTDADCKPISNQWISEMSCHFSNDKGIVIGYGAYKTIKGSFLNKLVRFETLMTAIQYFSYAKLGQPYMAVGRNLAYKKELFFQARGFMNHMNVKSGDDDLFINQIANKKNAAICVSKNSFTESLPKQTFKSWIRQKRRHVSTANLYKLKHKAPLTLFYISQLLFWLIGTLLICFLFNWKIVIALIGLRFIFQISILHLAIQKLNEKGLIFMTPFLELFLIVIQFYIFIKNLFSKSNHWE